MELTETLRRRRMVRRYSTEPIPPGSAEQIAAAATSAPTAGNTQGITIVTVTSPDTIEAVASACGEADYVERGFDPWLSSASAHLVLCAEPDRYRARYAEADKDPAVVEAIPWWWVDAGAALMAMLLATVDLGLAAGFHGGHRADGVKRLLDIPDDVMLVGIVTIGHAAPDRRSASLDRPRRNDTIRRERW